MANNAVIPCEGVIHIDVFDIQVPLFISDFDRVEAGKAMGVEVTPTTQPINGAVGRDIATDGSWFYSMVINPEATPATWAHEASHLADFVMDALRMPMGLKNTEVRAYMVGCVFEQIAYFMPKIHKRARKAAKHAAKAGTKTKPEARLN